MKKLFILVSLMLPAIGFAQSYSRWRAIQLVLCLSTLLFSLSARAGSVTWTNTTGGAWSVAMNWSSHAVPTSGDDVLITSAGTYTVTMDVSPTISSLTLGGASGVQTLTNSSKTLTVTHASAVNANGVFGMNAGTVTGTGSLTVAGVVQWNGGASGSGFPVTVQSGAVLDIQVSFSFAGPVTNHGTVNLLNGTMSLNTNSTTANGEFWNQAGALFDIQSGSAIASVAQPAIFHNAGTLRKDIVAGSPTISVFLDNSGTVQAKTGTLTLSGGSNLGGTFQADSGAAIAFYGGTFVLSTPPNFQGPGTVQFTAGSLTLSAFTGSLTLNGIGLVGQNTIAASGIINLNGTSLGNGASLTILSNAMLNLQASASFAGPVTNHGTVNLLNGTMSLNTNGPSANGEFWNQAGALFDIQSGSGIASVAQPAIFHNAGTLRKSANSGNSGIGVNLDNTGTILAQVGVIAIQGSYSESSTATLASSLSGLAPGTGFGTIQFTAVPAFAGKFALKTLNGYRPNSGDSFLVISYPSFTGGFTSYSGLDLGGGLQLTPDLAASGLTLVAGGPATPGLAGISLSGVNAILHGVNGQSGGTYITLMGTNLAKPFNQWSPIATNLLTANGNFTITLTNAVDRTMRQRFYILQIQ